MFYLFDVHHFPMLHLNVHQCTFSCIPGMRYTYGLCILMNSFDLRCEDVTCMYVYVCVYFCVCTYVCMYVCNVCSYVQIANISESQILAD